MIDTYISWPREEINKLRLVFLKKDTGKFQIGNLTGNLSNIPRFLVLQTMEAARKNGGKYVGP
jgi:hypothetical protein